MRAATILNTDMLAAHMLTEFRLSHPITAALPIQTQNTGFPQKSWNKFPWLFHDFSRRKSSVPDQNWGRNFDSVSLKASTVHGLSGSLRQSMINCYPDISFIVCISIQQCWFNRHSYILKWIMCFNYRLWTASQDEPWSDPIFMNMSSKISLNTNILWTGPKKTKHINFHQ